MSAWKAKRFWAKAEVEACDGGFTIRLDARPVKTPAKAAFVVPSLGMAQACSAEWDAQTGVIRPDTMPMTRYANSAIDKVARQHADVVGIVAAYGETDLLCYRATEPEALLVRQSAAWDVHLDWAATALDARLQVTQGVIPIPQDAASLSNLHRLTAALNPFQLAPFHDFVAITGSLILGFAMARDRLTADEAFTLSRIDEHWQAEFWGQDEDAAQMESGKRAALSEAQRFFRYHG